MNVQATTSFAPSMRRLSSSWSYVRSDFSDTFKKLKSEGAFAEFGPGKKIWNTRSRFVLQIALPEGGSVVFKSFRRISRPLRFVLRPSLCGFEAEYFQRIADLGISVPELLGAGDERKCFILKNAFLITRFAEGFQTGAAFKEKAMENNRELLDEFLRRNLQLLARCHDAGIIHRGSTPSNMMWKERQTPDADGHKLDLLWIDLASCRRRPLFLVNRACVKDLRLFFKPLELPREMQEELIGFYCASRKNAPPAAAQIIRKFFA